MKFEYSTPMISVEVLEKADILMTSAEVTPTEPKDKELENSYRDIMDFIGSGDFFD